MRLLRTFIGSLSLLVLSLQTSAAETEQTLVDFLSVMSEGHWASKYSDWFTRTSALPNPGSFHPTRSALTLAVLRNTRVEPDGFTMALFKASSLPYSDDPGVGGIVVDAMGRVLVVTKYDYAGLARLAQSIVPLPSTGRFRNTWVLDQPRTEQPIERMLVAVAGSSEIKETCVQGFSKEMTRLKYTVDEGVTELPPSLAELVGVVLEARAGYIRGDKDSNMISHVKSLLGDLV